MLRGRRHPDAAEGRRLARSTPVSRLAGAAVVIISLLAGWLMMTGGDRTPLPAHIPDSGPYAGVTQRQLSLGDPDAPVTLIEYADMQCSLCAQFSETVLPELVRRYIKAGKLRLDLRPVALIGPGSQAAARAVVAAGERDRAVALAAEMFAHQGRNETFITDAFIGRRAEEAGVNAAWLLRAAADQRTQANVDTIAEQAIADGVDHVPFFLIRRAGAAPRKVKLTELELSQFTGPIDRALTRR